jgi:hypothetical protein
MIPAVGPQSSSWCEWNLIFGSAGMHLHTACRAAPLLAGTPYIPTRLQVVSTEEGLPAGISQINC